MNTCPTCGSPNPAMHPAVQHEGECELCVDAWHDAARDRHPEVYTAVVEKRRHEGAEGTR